MSNPGKGRIQWGYELTFTEEWGGHVEQQECNNEQDARRHLASLQKSRRIESWRLIKRFVGDWEPTE